MESSMLKMIKSRNPDKEYPSNLGKKWTDDEECILLEELHTNVDIKTIAQKHGRTIGGIISRQKHMAYRMFLNSSSMESMVRQTKLDAESIRLYIEMKQNIVKKPKKEKPKKEISVLPKNEDIPKVDEENINITSQSVIDCEISNMKKDIGKIKRDIRRIKKTVKNLYNTLKLGLVIMIIGFIFIKMCDFYQLFTHFESFY